MRQLASTAADRKPTFSPWSCCAPHRGRDHRPRPSKRPAPLSRRGVPAGQTLAISTAPFLDHPPPSLPHSLAGSPPENLCLSLPPGRGKSPARRARVAAVLAGTGSATSPPPSWSRPSTGPVDNTSDWSSTPCSERPDHCARSVRTPGLPGAQLRPVIAPPLTPLLVIAATGPSSPGAVLPAHTTAVSLLSAPAPRQRRSHRRRPYRMRESPNAKTGLQHS